MKSLDIPLVEIQKAVIHSLPLGQRAIRSNGREFFSKYFVVVRNKVHPAESSRIRYYVHVYVLGDRRPYTVEGLVRKEVRQKTHKKNLMGSYSDVGVDSKLSRIFMRKVKNNLSKRREERNVVDDFRVF